MPLKMAWAQATVISGQVYVGGGNTDSDENCYLVCKYDPVRNEWSILPRAPVMSFGVGQLNEKLLLVGGMLENEARTADVRAFENSQQWEKSIPAMPSPRSAAAVLSHKNSLVISGGKSDTGEPCATIFVYCSLTSQWSSVGPLPFPCWRQSCAVLHNSCFFAGGQNGPHTHQQRKSIISTIFPSCSLMDNLPDMPHYDSSIAAIGGSILAIGGASKVMYTPMDALFTAVTTFSRNTPEYAYGESTSSNVYAYCPSASSWVHIGDIPAPRNKIATATLPSGELFIMGGGDINNKFSKTVYLGSIESIA